MAATQKENYLRYIDIIQGPIATMQMQIDAIMEDKDLMALADAAFSDYSMFDMEDVVVPILDLFTRSSLTLSVYRAVCDDAERLYGAELSGAERDVLAKSKQMIANTYQKCICESGFSVLAGFRQRLLREYNGSDKLSDLKSLIMRFLGTTHSNLLSEPIDSLEPLILAIGLSVKKDRDASILAKALSSIPVETPVSPGKILSPDEFLETLTEKEIFVDRFIKKIEQINKEKELEDSFNDRYIYWNYQKLELFATNILTAFSDISLRFSCYEAQLCAPDMRMTASHMPEEVQTRYKAVLEKIERTQIICIRGTAAHAMEGVLNALEIISGKGLKSMTHLDMSLVYWFYPGMHMVGATRSPATKELVGLLRELYTLTDSPSAKSLLSSFEE